ncbi:MFS transporter [Streptomyces sp. NPDC056653]|uniref:MFS transporter n=1 Tax=Streptomyces sp. NPDC056653 TaxID=3345894 RepID=UPI0036BD57C2
MSTRIASRLVRAAPHRSGVLSHGAGFWVIAFAFLVAMAFSTAPTPLWALYRSYDGFSTFMVTVAFTAYALGVVMSLFLAGHVSDWLGRRRVLLPAVLLEAVAAVGFLTSASLPMLIAARLVSGLGVGMINATATAHLSELHSRARPEADRTRSDLVAMVANMGGFALGPLISGILAQYVGNPLRTPYLVFLVLLVVAAAGIVLVPETVERPQQSPRYRPQRVSVPAESRSAFFAASSAALAAFAVLGLFTSLAPGFVAGTLHHPGRALAGVVTFLVFGAAAGTQIALARIAVSRQLAAGLGLMGAGLVGVTAAVWLPSLALFLIGGIAAGAGTGALFKGTVSTVAGLAVPGARGEALAGLFLAAYIGLAIPVLGLGIATRYVADRTALLGFSAVLVAMCVAVSHRLLRRR